MPRFTQLDIDQYNARRVVKGNAPPKTARPSEVKESEIQAAIATYLRSFGHDCHFDVCRMDRATTGTVGRPDFLGALRGVGFALEVKRPGGKETREQAGELLRWQLAGFRVAVVHSLAEAVAFISSAVKV